MTEHRNATSVAPAAPPARGLFGESTSYGIVLGLLIAAAGTAIVAPSTRLSFAAVIGLQGAAVLLAGSSARGPRRLLPLLLGLVLVTVVLAVLPSSAGRLAATMLDVLVLLALPVTIVARFRRDMFVSVQSIFGAVSIYLVIGMLYAVIDHAASLLAGQPFFSQAAKGASSDYAYFSFVTLCTVGYGDLTPGTYLGRALAASEALLGQIYLVTVLALVVTNLGHTRQPNNPPAA